MLSADNPLKDPAKDRLNRWPFAVELARSIRTIRPDNGFVYSLTGSWGSGKTTVLNFTAKLLGDQSGNDNDRVVVVHFNAWWISGSDRLLHDFFKDLRFRLDASFARKVKRLSKSLAQYSKALEPVPYLGRWFAVLHRFNEVHKARKQDLNELRKKIDGKLENFPGRIVVVIDDIDRLRPDEIRLVFRLVKAVADFPRTIYLLVYDESIVAKAFGDDDLKAGREYLDKVVQLTLTIPMPDHSTLKDWFREELNNILEGTPERLLNCAETHDRLGLFVDQFLTTPRRVVRFLNLLQATYPMVLGEVNANHFVWIQALRQFTPTLHTLIANTGGRLHGLDGSTNESTKEVMQDLEQGIKQALTTDLVTGHTTVAKASMEILGTLFNPVMDSSIMADNCSIGHTDYFHRYFLLGVPPGSLSEAERDATMALLPDAAAFGSKLKELASPVRHDGGSRLREFLFRLQWDDRVHSPVDNVEAVLRAFYAVGDELLSGGPLADRSDPERIAFVKELWDVTREILFRNRTPDERRKLLATILGDAKGPFTVSYHVKKFDSELVQQAIVGAVGPYPLNRLAVECFRKAADDGTLPSTPFLCDVLARYSEWAGRAEVQEYLRGLIKTDQGLCDCLVGLVSQGELDRSSVEELLSDNRYDLARRCKNILEGRHTWLTERHRAALKSYLERVEGSTASVV